MEPDQNNGTFPAPSAGSIRVQAVNIQAVLSHIISQLKPGADLSRITLPTFILEERSMLERITKCVRPVLSVPSG